MLVRMPHVASGLLGTASASSTECRGRIDRTTAMRIVTYTVDQILSKPRPESYLAELSACALQRSETALTIDLDSACVQLLHARYASYIPTPADMHRAAIHQAQASRQSAQQADGAISGSKKGCDGCGGREIGF